MQKNTKTDDQDLKDVLPASVEQEQIDENRKKYVGNGMAIGMCIGVAFGMFFIGRFNAAAIAVGVLIGSILGARIGMEVFKRKK